MTQWALWALRALALALAQSHHLIAIAAPDFNILHKIGRAGTAFNPQTIIHSTFPLSNNAA